MDPAQLTWNDSQCRLGASGGWKWSNNGMARAFHGRATSDTSRRNTAHKGPAPSHNFPSTAHSSASCRASCLFTGISPRPWRPSRTFYRAGPEPRKLNIEAVPSRGAHLHDRLDDVFQAGGGSIPELLATPGGIASRCGPLSRGAIGPDRLRPQGAGRAAGGWSDRGRAERPDIPHAPFSVSDRTGRSRAARSGLGSGTRIRGPGSHPGTVVGIRCVRWACDSVWVGAVLYWPREVIASRGEGDEHSGTHGR